MRSSTFRFDRSRRAGAWAAGIMVVLGLLPRAYQRHGDPSLFWQEKLEASACCDLVVAGDSRVYRGVSPEDLSSTLKHVRVLNFGFSGLGYDATYLNAVERALDPHSAQQTIVLGISPASLCRSSARENDFIRRVRSHGPWESQRVRWFHRILNWFTPFGPGDVRHWFHLIVLSENRGNHEWYQKDGWVATACVAPCPDAALSGYARLFAREKVDAEIVDAVLHSVRKWRAQGIAVFGFRPPIAAELAQLENDCSGFGESDFAAAFEEAGGIWLTSDGPYTCFDGSHLDGASARQLSLDLGRQLRTHQLRFAGRQTEVIPYRR